MTSPDPDGVTVVLDLLIPMRDGIRLAANLYRPAGNGPWPCLVNYLPYHKDGRGGLWYDAIHRWFAGHGYAALVIDFRGLGCSEGTNNVPFDAQEGRDAYDAVEWAAAQPWCDGNLGMWGSSYGGITALKAAAERPPHLKAIVPINATLDNYYDFLLLGGCRNGFWSNGDWGSRMVAYNLTPPLREDADGRLAELWRSRLEQTRPWCLDWYDAADEPARWAERAIPAERITAATFAVCGWKDFYAQGTLDYFRRLPAPKKLLMGPWKHAFPNLSPEEPLDLLTLMVQWWDRWLRGTANGSDAGPPLTLFVQGGGSWRHEDAWPPARNQPRELYLAPGGLAEQPAGATAAERYVYNATVGLDSIAFDPWTTAVTHPGEHHGDDARSLCFTTAPLPSDCEVTGETQLRLAVRTSVSGLTFAAKLCDVAPSGGSRLVTMGWGLDSAAADSVHRVVVPLRGTSHIFRAGHRIRLSLALADFPRLWPTPEPAEVWLEYGATPVARLLLPVTPPQTPGLPLPQLPAAGPPPKSALELDASQEWHVGRELVRQTAALQSRSNSAYRLADGGTVRYGHEYTARVSAAAPDKATIAAHSTVEVQRPSGTVSIETNCVFTPDDVTVRAEITQDRQLIFRKEWQARRGDPVAGREGRL